MSSHMTSDALRQGLNAKQVETAERLLAAGLAELRAVGHESLTIRNVAERAGVSAATAYTYLASRNHLVVELFWRHLTREEWPELAGGVVERVQQAMRGIVQRIVAEPELASAVTPALLGNDPDVARLRLRIGGEFARRLAAGLATDGEEVDPELLEALALVFSGALLQAGMGVMTYDAMAERLAHVVAVILRGNT